jgi:hypothetical protein
MSSIRASFIVILSLMLAGCSNKGPAHLKFTCAFTDYTYYAGTKELLGDYVNNYILVSFDSLATESQIRQKITANKDFDQNYAYLYGSSKNIALRLSKSKNCDEMAALIGMLEMDPMVNYASYCFKSSCSNVLGYQYSANSNFCIGSNSNYFLVKLIDQYNLTALNQIAAETNTEIVSRDSFMHSWYVLKTTKKSKGNGLQMANYFQETGKFKATEAALFYIPVE